MNIQDIESIKKALLEEASTEFIDELLQHHKRLISNQGEQERKIIELSECIYWHLNNERELQKKIIELSESIFWYRNNSKIEEYHNIKQKVNKLEEQVVEMQKVIDELETKSMADNVIISELRRENFNIQSSWLWRFINLLLRKNKKKL